MGACGANSRPDSGFVVKKGLFFAKGGHARRQQRRDAPMRKRGLYCET